jgi:hypothetical protein
VKEDLQLILKHLQEAQACANKAKQMTVAILIQSAIDEVKERLQRS